MRASDKGAPRSGDGIHFGKTRLHQRAIGVGQRPFSRSVQRVAKRCRFDAREDGRASEIELVHPVAQVQLSVALFLSFDDGFGVSGNFTGMGPGIGQVFDQCPNQTGAPARARKLMLLEHVEELVPRKRSRSEHERNEKRVGIGASVRRVHEKVHTGAESRVPRKGFSLWWPDI